jgi:hypothetical protein
MESVLEVWAGRPMPSSFPMFIAETMEIIETKKIKNKLGCLVAVAEVLAHQVPPLLAMLMRDKVLIHDVAAVLAKASKGHMKINVRTWGCLSR